MDSLIIVPAYNESRTIAEVVKQAKRFGRVAVVDDGSDDNTAELAEKAGATVLQHIVNLGKGAALKTGCEFAVMEGADRIVVIDGDAQHNPEKIPRFFELLDDYDVVFGCRMFSKDMPVVMRFGNSFINTITRLLYGVSLHDTQCGYRAFTADTYKKLRWNSQDYSVESEMVSKVGKKRLRYTELPIETIYHDRYKGTTVLDGVRIVLKMLWWRLS